MSGGEFGPRLDWKIPLELDSSSMLGLEFETLTRKTRMVSGPKEDACVELVKSQSMENLDPNAPENAEEHLRPKKIHEQDSARNLRRGCRTRNALNGASRKLKNNLRAKGKKTLSSTLKDLGMLDLLDFPASERRRLVMFWLGLALKPWLWLGFCWLWLPLPQARAKATGAGMAWPGFGLSPG
ncbi:hypothetical protein B0H16DRAFT_1465442 [Mycena metata]|uniref:Uncharacterized protein n=1 Tax=Mycena metata TaxID=1033252 RepID=A0AAD7MYZ0_9AGAR|nr:hypothetical protein B0H16DRAFT_1465442 [Mycena metata]